MIDRRAPLALLLAACAVPPEPRPAEIPAAPVEPGGPGPVVDTEAMVRIPAGTFAMGHADEPFAPYGSEWKENELPRHSVTLREYYIDRDEVTAAEYAAFLGAGGAPLHHRRHQAVVKTSERYAAAPGREREPITFVSWADAEAYCAWAGKALPTEAEWERAAKGGAGERRFPWGDEAPTCERAVLFARVDCEPGVAPVGSRSPQGDSPDGCRDMAGNVAEWTADWYGPYSEDAAEDPTGPAEGTLRVMRGGNFRDPPAAVRTTARWGAEPTAYSEAVGFRCVFRP